jgi:hypothetical protein
MGHNAIFEGHNPSVGDIKSLDTLYIGHKYNETTDFSVALIVSNIEFDYV